VNDPVTDGLDAVPWSDSGFDSHSVDQPGRSSKIGSMYDIVLVIKNPQFEAARSRIYRKN
jgi:hypothetical protein